MVLSDVDKLILRLEHTHTALSGGERAVDDQWGSDALGKLMGECLHQVDDVRLAIREREKIAKQGKNVMRTPAGIAASSNVRRELNELMSAAERLRKAHEQRRRQSGAAASRPTQEDREVGELLRLVEECIDSERSGAREEARSGGGGGGGESSGGSSTHSSPTKKKPSWTPVTSLEAAAAGGGGSGGKGGSLWGRLTGVAKEKPTTVEGLREGLLQIEERDAAMEVGLDAISEGIGRLRHLAVDMNSEVRVQSVMLDEIAARAAGAQGEMENINLRLGKTLKAAGGASRVLINLVLFILFFSLLLFIYTTVKEGLPNL